MTRARRALPSRCAGFVGVLALVLALASCGGPSAPDGPRPGVPIALQIAGGHDVLGLQFSRSQPYQPLSLVALDVDGDTVPVPAPVAFTSRAPDVLTVDAEGRMWMHRTGDAWVVVRAGSGARVIADSIELLVRCTADLRPVFTPREATLRVGQELAPSLRILLCSGEMEDTDELRWHASDPEVLDVDPSTGLARALKPGTTWLNATGREYGNLGAVDVVVVP